MTTWVTCGCTESGDDLPIVIWKKKPSKKKVDAWYRDWSPIEYEEVGFVNWRLEEADFGDE